MATSHGTLSLLNMASSHHSHGTSSLQKKIGIITWNFIFTKHGIITWNFIFTKHGNITWNLIFTKHDIITWNLIFTKYGIITWNFGFTNHSITGILFHLLSSGGVFASLKIGPGSAAGHSIVIPLTLQKWY